jgi:hypothetical protein
LTAERDQLRKSDSIKDEGRSDREYNSLKEKLKELQKESAVLNSKYKELTQLSIEENKHNEDIMVDITLLRGENEKLREVIKEQEENHKKLIRRYEEIWKKKAHDKEQHTVKPIEDNKEVKLKDECNMVKELSKGLVDIGELNSIESKPKSYAKPIEETNTKVEKTQESIEDKPLVNKTKELNIYELPSNKQEEPILKSINYKEHVEPIKPQEQSHKEETVSELSQSKKQIVTKKTVQRIAPMKNPFAKKKQ